MPIGASQSDLKCFLVSYFIVDYIYNLIPAYYIGEVKNGEERCYILRFYVWQQSPHFVEAVQPRVIRSPGTSFAAATTLKTIFGLSYNFT